jgi:hypothetical protein
MTLIIIISIVYFIGSPVEQEISAGYKLQENNADKLLATWKWESESGKGESSEMIWIWTFYENGTIKQQSEYKEYSYPSILFAGDQENRTMKLINYFPRTPTWGKWEVSNANILIDGAVTNGVLFICTDNGTGSYEKSNGLPVCPFYTAIFSSDFNQLTVKTTVPVVDDSLISYSLMFSKINESEIEDSPPLSNYMWENINISIECENKLIHWDWINLTRSTISYSGENAPSEWGSLAINDIIEIGDYPSDTTITVRFTWILTNSLIDSVIFR